MAGKIYYSPSTEGFYDTDFHASEQIPVDVTEIPREYRDQLIAAQAQGLRIQAAEGGFPVAVGRTVAEVGDGVWSEIKAMRDRRLVNGGFMLAVDGVPKWFHSDLVSRTQQITLDRLAEKMKAAGAPDTQLVTPVPWKTMDGTSVPMTIGLARQLLEAIAQHEGQNFTAAETHKAAMLASLDPASYDYSAGWPLSFGEA